MSATGLDVFDKSINTTNIWLNEISSEIGPDRQLAWHVLGVVLRTLRDRLPAQDAAHLAAQLPLIVRGAFYEQYRPTTTKPEHKYSEAEFVHCVAEGLSDVRPVNPTAAIHAVFSTLERHATPGLTAKVKQTLPDDIRSLWPEPEVRQSH
jgi:uncharacterized protein (DUF2267 family)